MIGTKRAWRATQLLWKSWQDGDIVRNAASGNTHLLTPLASQVLRKLEQHSANSVELAQGLAADNGLEIGEDLVKSVEELLAHLDELGLIDPISQ